MRQIRLRSHDQKTIVSYSSEHVDEWTGLTGKLGVELWENDVVAGAVFNGIPRNGRIVYELDSFIVTDGEYSVYLSSCFSTLSVIGSFHKNPELLCQNL